MAVCGEGAGLDTEGLRCLVSSTSGEFDVLSFLLELHSDPYPACNPMDRVY